MHCPNCNEENVSSAKFCKNCGASLLQAQNQFNQSETQAEDSQGKNNLVIGIIIAAVILIVGAFLIGQGFFAKNQQQVINNNSNQSQVQINQSQTSTTTQNQKTNQSSASVVRDNGTATAQGDNKIAAEFSCGKSQVKDASGITYGTVVAEDGKCWLDRNLGAAQVATSSADEKSYGWYFQWGRGADGHQIPTSGTTTTLSSSDNPGNAKFIIADSNTYTYDWRSPQNDRLWQGVSGINNPCPVGFRVPTQEEWTNLVDTSHITSSATAYSSSSKLPLAGNRNYSGSWLGQGSYGYYWSSSPSGTGAANLYFNSTYVYPANTSNRADGFSVRCLKG